MVGKGEKLMAEDQSSNSEYSHRLGEVLQEIKYTRIKTGDVIILL